MKIIAVLPAYNAEKTLEKTLADIPKGSVHEVILVDDCSKDGTVELSRRLGLHTVVHEKNRGYGGNQKTCYAEALKRGADIVIMIHPDYQYDARLTPVMTGLIASGVCDVVLGNRIRTRWEALEGGMPFYKYIFNRLLTIMENSVTGQNLGEWHSGLRAYSRQVLETVRWELNSDDFVFDQQFLIQAASCRFRLGDVPVPVRYFPEASSINFKRSVVYGLSTLVLLVEHLIHKSKLVRFGFLTAKTH
ncbi:MAG: glycosyltransferase family 2 protein [Elusimicrobia bacterium]|nr:glycosyltransferase family 2 protein [Elusimicrobiota bacterium]